MALKLASLTTAKPLDHSVCLVQILLGHSGTKSAPVFHAVRIWVPQPFQIYLRRRLEEISTAAPFSSLLGTLVLSWDITIRTVRNVDVSMPNLLCHDLLPDFLQLLRKIFLRITTNLEYETLFPHKLENLHFQFAFDTLGNLTTES